MKEDFLHYVWQYKKFSLHGLKTVRGEEVVLLNSGQYLQQAGPDFFYAQVIIGGQKWAGNVEIHVKSSDWYIHNHEQDGAYDNVILHVVWEHDAEVLREDNSEIPVLELQHYVDKSLQDSYRALSATKSWIYCENELASINTFVLGNWKERLFFERLQRKAAPVTALAKETGYDWEAVLFCFMAKNFGLNTNGEPFFKMALSLPFTVVRKESFEAENIEALLFGRAGLLQGDYEDVYARSLQQRYNYLAHKYRLSEFYTGGIQFFKHRPDNFPTIRLSQLAQLYHHHQNLFTQIINAASIQELYDIFKVQASPYWQSHYRFDRESPKKRKALTAPFMDLLIINTIIPFRFAYAQSLGKEISEELIALLGQVPAEKNAVVDKFIHFKVPVASAYDTQSLLQLKNEYCNKSRCMQCAIGLELLKSSPLKL
ncbi:hypothetical protein CHU92_05910 [Flavobacterium cyanobacteriorum]|uniref:DUF2851 domain-containing protein n=1 Tax=Flavobacterium cyanobacteriorum TaxID=2022802 RepID=A0A255ZBG0_9FLAO|nr:DUF2851 family protein [Flavobacterium cyanobacteriorum]OYQ38244.1 hypothetical protein CHU92_05910 [Flavobacterium cyanobacteriorum]